MIEYTSPMEDGRWTETVLLEEAGQLFDTFRPNRDSNDQSETSRSQSPEHGSSSTTHFFFLLSSSQDQRQPSRPTSESLRCPLQDLLPPARSYERPYHASQPQPTHGAPKVPLTLLSFTREQLQEWSEILGAKPFRWPCLSSEMVRCWHILSCVCVECGRIR